MPLVGQAVAYVPTTPVSNVIIFLSGDGRWNLGVVDWARRIMPKAIVIGVDFVALKNAKRGACWLPAGDVEEISHAAQKTLHLPEYHPPIVVGYSSGATLVYEVLASGPPGTFAGGLSLGFCPDLPALQPVCSVDGFKGTYDAKASTAWLPKVSRLPQDWYVLNGELDQVCIPVQMRVFLNGIENTHYVEIPHTGHGFGKPQYWGRPFDEAIDALLASASARPAAAARPVTAGAAALQASLARLDLPLEPHWSDRPRASLIFISGDGGWASLDEHVAEFLAARGVHVVGVNSLRYFWSARTPSQTAADVGRVADVLAGASLPFFIGGYSFGAEVTPFIVQSWAEAKRIRAAGQVLIAPGETASFEVSPLDWVMRARETPLRVADAVRRNRVRTLCLSGAGEQARDTACDDVTGAATSVALPGSHHFNGDYAAVGQAVLDFIDHSLLGMRDTRGVPEP